MTAPEHRTLPLLTRQLTAPRTAASPQDSTQPPISSLSISRGLPTPVLPDGFRLKSLAEDDDPHKVNGLLHRGFGHGDEPPDDAVASRKFMQSAPGYSLDLNIVVEAPGPDGSAPGRGALFTVRFPLRS